MIAEAKHRTVKSVKTAGLNFVITNTDNRGIINPVVMSTDTAELSVRSHRPDACDTAGYSATVNGDLKWPLFVSFA